MSDETRNRAGNIGALGMNSLWMQRMVRGGQWNVKALVTQPCNWDSQIGIALEQIDRSQITRRSMTRNKEKEKKKQKKLPKKEPHNKCLLHPLATGLSTLADSYADGIRTGNTMKTITMANNIVHKPLGTVYPLGTR